MSNIEPTNPYEAPATIDDPLVDPDQFYDGGLRTAAIGLKLIYVGILVILITWVFGIMLSMLGMWTVVVGSITGFGPMIGLLMVFIGPLICLSVPNGIGLRRIVVSSVLAQVLAIVFLVTALSVMAETPLVAFVAWMLLLISITLFLVFLHRLAGLIDRGDLVRRARNVLIFGCVIFFVMTPVVWLIDFDVYDVAGPVYYVTLALSILVFMVMCANLMNALSIAIRYPRLQKPLVGIA